MALIDSPRSSLPSVDDERDHTDPTDRMVGQARDDNSADRGVVELLKARGRIEKQHPGGPRLDGVAVGDVLGTKEERSGRSLYRLFADLERQLPFENPESLVLVVVHAQP